MKKFIVSEVVPNQEYKIESYDENEAMIKGALNTIQDIVNDIHKELFGEDEDCNKHFISISADEWDKIRHIRAGNVEIEDECMCANAHYPVSEKINREENKEFDGFKKFKEDFGYEVCDSPILGTHKFINMLFRNYFRFTTKDESLLNNIEDLLHRQTLQNGISLFEIFDHLNLVDYTMEPELFDKTMHRFFNIVWDEENQLDISINVMSPVDENDTAEFYIVFNSAPKWIR